MVKTCSRRPTPRLLPTIWPEMSPATPPHSMGCLARTELRDLSPRRIYGLPRILGCMSVVALL
eukprot:11161833-Lingulodinium_polyedra.AAC.1